MCLAVPGRIVAISGLPPAAAELPPAAAELLPADRGLPLPADDDSLWRLAEVDFGGVRQTVSLACLPEAVVGDRVLVHVGIALTIVEEEPE
jgi:hydrogenase expression/formation protein HypC